MRQAHLALVASRPAPLPLTATPQLRGYHVEYTVGETNRRPGCSATAWLVGRFSAECGRCGTALPIAHPFHEQAEENPHA